MGPRRCDPLLSESLAYRRRCPVGPVFTYPVATRQVFHMCHLRIPGMVAPQPVRRGLPSGSVPASAGSGSGHPDPPRQAALAMALINPVSVWHPREGTRAVAVSCA
ncbi:hypothetical protein GCM10023405_48930 [Streptomonospora salina]